MPIKIKLLPEQVANQIAAGEVVDRPASVVKELAENSLDAGAGRVSIEIEQGGKRSIRVIDDGEGMSRDDALLCLERHATSKIEKSADLFAIDTLGFRGEAIPSIASVSRMRIATRERGADSGTVVAVEGGRVTSVEEAGLPPGTEIAVQSLFFNVPARRKFMKSVQTELGHVTTLVSNMALARPEVHVSLSHNGHTVFDLPASADLSGRLRHALGSDAMRSLVRVEREFTRLLEAGSLRVHGYVSVPSYTRTSTRSLHLFVNRRFVRDRLINHAVFEAYRTLVPKGRYPLVVLFVDLPPDAVDVNVHPAKHEIRFREQGQVHDAVVDSIRGSLRAADGVGAEPRAAYGRGVPDYSSRPATDNEVVRGAAEALRRFNQRPRPAGLFDREGSREYGNGQGKRYEAKPASASTPQPESGLSVPEEAPAALPPPRMRFSELRVIGQFGRSYLLCEDRDSLVIVDQHAAHERIAFERLKKDYEATAVARQPLLFPETLELSREEAARVSEHQELLLRLGFEVEPFGGDTVAVKSLPAMLAGTDPAKLLLEVVDRLEDPGRGAVLDNELDELFSVMACHSVVRANERMSEEEMRALLSAMDGIDFPGHCPHGRDAVVRVQLSELEKWFGR